MCLADHTDFFGHLLEAGSRNPQIPLIMDLTKFDMIKTKLIHLHKTEGDSMQLTTIDFIFNAIITSFRTPNSSYMYGVENHDR